MKGPNLSQSLQILLIRFPFYFFFENSFYGIDRRYVRCQLQAVSPRTLVAKSIRISRGSVLCGIVGLSCHAWQIDTGRRLARSCSRPRVEGIDIRERDVSWDGDSI